FAKVKVLNLEIVKTFPEQNILLVKGAVPGPNGGIVVVEKTTRKMKKEPQKPKDTKKKKK
ncbi:LSU ribosomal protein L3p (L3e), partial [hydrothermal vent metagenome]